MKSFKNLFFYRLGAAFAFDAAATEEALARCTFAPCMPTQANSTGFVPPRGDASAVLVEVVGGHAIMSVCTEKRVVPAQVLKRRVDEIAKQIEDSTGRKPGKKQTKELREQALLELLPQAFPSRGVTQVWIDPAQRLLAVGASSQVRADDVVSLLVKVIDGLIVGNVVTEMSPAAIMGGWLHDRVADFEEFTIGAACELKAWDETKAMVRYGRHNLDRDEITEHIRQGKTATRLALTWRDRVAFTLTDGMHLRGVQFLDVVFEGDARDKGAEEFDADIAIATGELGGLIPDLIEALGGEIKPEQQEAA